MVWTKAGTTTLTSAGDDLDITSMTASKFNVFLSHIFKSATTIQANMTTDNNTATDYAYRQSQNGGTDSTGEDQTRIPTIANGGNSGDEFTIRYGCNIAGEEKLFMSWILSRGTAGSAGVTRVQQIGKVDTTTNTGQFTRVDFNNSAGGDFAVDSNISALGSDLTPSAGKPTDVQVGSRLEETDTRKMYHKVDVTGADVSLTGLNAYFKFNEASGDLINHASSVGSTDEIAGNGTNSNVTYSQTGKIGSTYSYNGTSSKTEIDTLIPTSQTGSVFWWWKSSDGIDVIWGWGDTNADTFIFQEGTGSGESFTIYARNGGANKWWAKPSSNISSPLNTWHSACITHDGTAPLIYVDGVEGTTFTNSTDKTWWVPDFSGIDNFSLGFERRNNGLHNYFNGNIDELSVWSRALTAAEISTLHNSGTGKEINSDVWKEEGT